VSFVNDLVSFVNDLVSFVVNFCVVSLRYDVPPQLPRLRKTPHFLHPCMYGCQMTEDRKYGCGATSRLVVILFDLLGSRFSFPRDLIHLVESYTERRASLMVVCRCPSEKAITYNEECAIFTEKKFWPRVYQWSGETTANATFVRDLVHKECAGTECRPYGFCSTRDNSVIAFEPMDDYLFVCRWNQPSGEFVKRNLESGKQTSEVGTAIAYPYGQDPDDLPFTAWTWVTCGTRLYCFSGGGGYSRELHQSNGAWSVVGALGFFIPPNMHPVVSEANSLIIFLGGEVIGDNAFMTVYNTHRGNYFRVVAPPKNRHSKNRKSPQYYDDDAKDFFCYTDERFSGTVLDNEILFVCGESADCWAIKIERLIPITQHAYAISEWYRCASMNAPRGKRELVAIDVGRIVAVPSAVDHAHAGGWELYDLSTNSWKHLESPVPLLQPNTSLTPCSVVSTSC
jgi:hypothetical protein